MYANANVAGLIAKIFGDCAYKTVPIQNWNLLIKQLCFCEGLCYVSVPLRYEILFPE